MLSAIAIVPSAPVLVPELTGAAAAEVAEIRAAVIAAATCLPQRWIAIGADRATETVGAHSVGTFAGFGVDLRVGLSAAALGGAGMPVELPLCALIAAWVRGQANPEASAEVRVYADAEDSHTALGVGRKLRAEIDRAADPIGVVVVADGVHTLTSSAPGGYDPRNTGAQLALDEALASGDVAALTRLPGQVVGRVAFEVLAGLAEPRPRSAKELYRGAPYGVGYFTGVWQP